jgi:hypothetical protein
MSHAVDHIPGKIDLVKNHIELSTIKHYYFYSYYNTK